LNKPVSPAHRNRLLLEEFNRDRPEDRMAICAFVSPEYEHFVPDWVDCINRAYPQYEAVVIQADDTDKNRMAALRFIDGEEVLSQYEYVLITDVDILIMKESPSILYQHLLWMKKHDLGCYSNTIVDNIRFCGVHFLTKAWWDKTRAARDKYRQELKTSGCIWGDDEKILARIIIESGLNLTKEQMLWNHHGIHLGAYKRAETYNLNANQTLFLEEYLKRKGFASPNMFSNTIECLKFLSKAK